MTMECTCALFGEGEEPSVLRTTWYKARRAHQCCECQGVIQPGDRYEYVSGCWEGEWSHFSTCVGCAHMRDGLACGCGAVFGELAEVVWETFGHDIVTGKNREDET
jgi:hypothetical protein